MAGSGRDADRRRVDDRRNVRQGAARLELAIPISALVDRAVVVRHDRTGRTVLIRWKAAMLASSGYRHTLCRPLPHGGPQPAP